MIGGLVIITKGNEIEEISLIDTGQIYYPLLSFHEFIFGVWVHKPWGLKDLQYPSLSVCA